MSGAGRKSGYRKSVTDSFLNDYPLPEVGKSQVVKVKGVRGSNQIEIIDSNGQESLALLPNKFKKLIWVKRNDYVMVGISVDKNNNDDNNNEDEDDEEDGGNNNNNSNSSNSNIQYMIKNILGKDQIKHIKQKGLWPALFDVNNNNNNNNDTNNTTSSIVGGKIDNIGTVFNSMNLNNNNNNKNNNNNNIKTNNTDDLMPGYNSEDEFDDEDNLQLNQKLDKFGNTIIDEEDDDEESYTVEG